eukprot:TRINITY_DN543_c0_g1_i1.p1 TRINITY_DN543_c0_g1~~TRINITY_DN543_c0_g1_i1.p1  ORF type:complete len:211 (-),score=40.36 TRINITY_DN543_c0_g1_i1:92-724(-)
MNSQEREEARILAHAEKFTQRRSASIKTKEIQKNTLPTHQVTTNTGEKRGNAVQVVWVDRETSITKKIMQIETDKLGRIPVEFIKLNWCVKNLYWKDTQLPFRTTDDGYSASAVGVTSTTVFVYADNEETPIPPESLGTGVLEETFLPMTTLVNTIPVSTPTPTGESILTRTPTPTPVKSTTRIINFCSSCGTRVSPGSKFCSSCGSRLQ